MSDLQTITGPDAWRPGGLARPAPAAGSPRAARPPRGAAARVGAKQVRLSRRELLTITSQLAIMTRAGVDVASCLQSVARQVRRPAARQMLEQIHADVLAGNPVSESLNRYARVFGETFVAAVAAGEAAGRLPDVLAHLVRLQQSELRLRTNLRTVLAYPILLASVSLLVLAGLILFVLPNFAEIFGQYDVPLPALTRALLGLSHELRHRFWLYGALLLAAGGGLVYARAHPRGRLLWDSAALNLVLVRDVTRALLIGRICKLLGLMLDSGVPLLQCLRLTRLAVRNARYRELLGRLEDDVTNGRPLAGALLAAPFVPPAAAEMMATGERTGSLGMVADMIGQHYQEEGEAKLRELVTLLEPLIIVGMGVVVGLVVLSVMLPMFDIATLAQRGG